MIHTVLRVFITSTTAEPSLSISDRSSSCGNLYFTINAEDENGIKDFFIHPTHTPWTSADHWNAADNSTSFLKDIVYDMRTGEYDGFTPEFHDYINLNVRDRAGNLEPPSPSSIFTIQAGDNLSYSEGPSGGTPWSIQINNGDVNTGNNTLNLSLRATDKCGISSCCVARSSSDCSSEEGMG